MRKSWLSMGVLLLTSAALGFSSPAQAEEPGSPEKSLEQRFEESQRFVALGSAFVAIVVVDEDGVWVGPMRGAKSLGDVIVANGLTPRAVAQNRLAPIAHRFVDYVPLLDAAFVMTDNRHYMIAHILQRSLARQGLARGIAEEPVRCLRMPDQGVANHRCTALARHFD